MSASEERLSLDARQLGLSPLAPDPRRAATTRRRCADVLAMRAQRRARRAALQARAVDTVAPVLIVACSLFYAAALVANTLRVEGLLP